MRHGGREETTEKKGKAATVWMTVAGRGMIAAQMVNNLSPREIQKKAERDQADRVASTRRIWSESEKITKRSVGWKFRARKGWLKTQKARVGRGTSSK